MKEGSPKHGAGVREVCEFRVGDWCHDAKTQMKTLVNGVSTCRTESAGGCGVNRVHDYFVVTKSIGRQNRRWWCGEKV